MGRLLQLSDLHLVAPGRRASGVLDTPALLRAAIDQLIERRDAIGPVDAVVLSGDVSDDGSEASYAFARAELDRLALPILAVPGNHDRREGLRAAFADPHYMPGEGLIDWAVEVGDCLVVGLDTLVEGQGGGRLRTASLAHLERALRASDGREVVVVLHHPPLRTGIRFMDAIGLENPAEFAAVLSRFDGPLRVVAGHVHGIHHGRIGGHPVSTAMSTCSAFALDVRQDAPVGFLTGPRGCAVIDLGPGGAWSALMFDPPDGLHPF